MSDRKPGQVTTCWPGFASLRFVSPATVRRVQAVEEYQALARVLGVSEEAAGSILAGAEKEAAATVRPFDIGVARERLCTWAMDETA